MQINHRKRWEIKKDEEKRDILPDVPEKHKYSVVELNIDLINEDIKKLKAELKNVQSGNAWNKSINIKNLSTIIIYLEKLKNKTIDGNLELCWLLEDYRIKSYPEFRDVEEYGIRVTDYLNVSRDIIEIDLEVLADLISLEMMYKDLGETLGTIEEKLKDAPLIWIEPKELLGKVEDKIYMKSKFLKVEKSPCKHQDGYMMDYFGLKKHPDTEYRKAVECSVRYATSLVMENIFKKTARVGFKICGLSDYKVHLMADKGEQAKLMEIVKEPIDLTVFGRKFYIEPKITVY